VRFLAILLLGFFSSRAIAQTHTISGYVRDVDSGENLIGATVLDMMSRQGAVANTYGFYSITLSSDSADLVVSYVGYHSAHFKFLLDRDTSIVIRLQGATVLDEVTIEANRIEKIHETSRMGTVTVPTAQIKRVPAFMGEADVLKLLQLLPGVQAGNEGNSGLYVRGGGPDQNLFLLDGVPVYNPTHLYGFFSTFNADAIQHVELVKGGFPARYGGRLSSVVDIALKEGNQKDFHLQGAVGLISARIAVEGPIIKDRTSFIISARRSYLNLLNNFYVPKLPETPRDDYRFYDFNVKVNHKVNAKNRIYLSGYSGDDKGENYSAYSYTDNKNENFYDTRTSSSMGWGNTVASLRWNHTFGNRLFSNLSLNYSHYRMALDVDDVTYHKVIATGITDTTYYRHQYRSGIRDYGIRADFDFVPNPRHYIRFGAQVINHEFRPGAIAQKSSHEDGDRDLEAPHISANEFALFAEDDVNLTDRLKANVGVHASAFAVNDQVFRSIQPRVTTRHSLTSTMSLKGSFSSMQQYLHLLTNSGLGLPTDLWVPSTTSVPPQKAWQGGIGVAKTILDKFEFSFEGFYKSMKNVIEYKDGASYVDFQTDWQEKVEIGEGRSYGGEFFFQKKVGQWSGWVGYTLSWTERRFESINDGAWFPYRYDRRHDFKVTSSYSLGKHWDFGATWVFATGNAVTVPQFAYIGPDPANYPAIWYFPGRNNYRMRNYHRLDVSASYRISWRRTEHAVSVSVYNSYARQNPFYLHLVGTSRGMALKQESLFPIVPSLSYSFKF
jgi:hypothetical protein